MNSEDAIQSELRGSYEEAIQSNSRNTRRQVSELEYRRKMDALVSDRVTGFSASQAHNMARIASTPEGLKRFHIRATIENVRRIDSMRKINPLVCYRSAAHDAVLCKQFGLYAADEGLHARMFARDLHAMGVSDEEIYRTDLFFSTELLLGYLYQTLEEDGPLATVASCYYVELVSQSTQPAWLEIIENQLGPSVTKGSRAHLALDEHEEHIDVGWNMTMRLVKTPADRVRFERHIHRLHGLLASYVTEVVAYTLQEREPDVGSEVVRNGLPS